tara:strand:- start:1344 stop:1856 length:513 start_codon:yes stop_codon:yes gene_type:complete
MNKKFYDLKSTDLKFKNDDYETPSCVLSDLIPYIKNHKTIYDPFYCKGLVIVEWAKLNKHCINEKQDAFNREHPNYDILISNIPFSLKKECIELALSLSKPFALLMPIDTLGSKWMNKYFDKLQFIIPQKRYNFYKEGVYETKCWFNTMWVCSGLNLNEKIIKLGENKDD